ncbi:MAG: hypothetical protein ACJ788_15260 [Ktedonobacteraceae bacterium]
MIQGQFGQCGQQHIQVARAGRLLRQHPILMPVILLSGSFGLCFASFYTDALFPLLALVDAPTSLLCLAMAFVLGVSGVLTSIISIIEGIDRCHLRTATFLKPKGA